MVDLVAQSGLIESVSTDTAFAVLAADASSGDTVLSLESTDVLETETGTGQVRIGATVYDYSVDPDASTITLGSGLVAGASEGSRVEAYPAAPVTTAKVSLDTGDSVTARVAADHVLLLADGDRFGAEREFVTLYREGANYVTLDVPNVTATVKPGRIDPDALDGGDDDDTTDPYPDFPTAHLDLTLPDAWLVTYPNDPEAPNEFMAASGSTVPAPAPYSVVQYFTGTDDDFESGILIDPDHDGFIIDQDVYPIWYLPMTGPSDPALDVGLGVDGDGYIAFEFTNVVAWIGRRSGGPTDFGVDPDVEWQPVRTFTHFGPPFTSDPANEYHNPWPVDADAAGTSPGALFVYFRTHASESGDDGYGDHLRHIRVIIEEK